MSKSKWPVGLIGAAMSLGLLVATPITAGATGSSGSVGVSATVTGPTGYVPIVGPGFANEKAQLEKDLAVRQTQLASLTSTVNAAVNLSASDKATLQSRLATETANIDGLIQKVPNDTTLAELRADANSMYKDNRVFAVMTPQVYAAIKADNVLAMVVNMQSTQVLMNSEISARSTDTGAKAATNQYTSYVKLLSDASLSAAKVDATVMLQTPAGYPKNLRTFDQASNQLGSDGNRVSNASSDATLIQLFVENNPIP